MSLWRKTPSCTCANAVIAVSAASAFSSKTPFCPVTIVSPADWSPMLSTHSRKLSLQRRLGLAIISPPFKYFAQFSNRKEVKYFICDMNPHFRRVAKVCFPNATIVADRYHVVRQVYWAMEKVRKNEQNKLSQLFRKYFKRSRNLLMKRTDKLTQEDMHALTLMFEIAPRLADAYRLKNEFLAVIRSNSSEEGRQRLSDWLFSVELMGLSEFRDCTKAYHNWAEEILNSMDVPWSKGYIEGCNNKTIVLKRISYGMRNCHNLRKRIHFCNT